MSETYLIAGWACIALTVLAWPVVCWLCYVAGKRNGLNEVRRLAQHLFGTLQDSIIEDETAEADTLD